MKPVYILSGFHTVAMITLNTRILFIVSLIKETDSGEMTNPRTRKEIYKMSLEPILLCQKRKD